MGKTKLKEGVNDLATVHPELAAQWHPTKNGDLTPAQITHSSHTEVWWYCSTCGYEWQNSPNARRRGRGCPVCAGKVVMPGYNDLATLCPEVAAEWHPTKNGDLLPSQVTKYTVKEVWWFSSKCGHEWKVSPNSRSRGRGCQVCAKEMQTSFAEQAIFYYFGKIFSAENRYKHNGKTEIDVYLPEYKIGIEYDGYFHRSKSAAKKEMIKNTLLQNAGITLFRVKEVADLAGYVDSDTVIYCKETAHYRFVNEVINKLLCRINKLTSNDFKLDVDVERDRAEIYALYIITKKKNSLAALHPELAAEWHPTLNGVLLPEQVTANSSKEVWWLGSCGHEWSAKISNRVNAHSGCPYCAGKKALPGFNDLATTHPELAAQWHPIKNGDLTPAQFTYGSNKKVWWRCAEGHEWQAAINSRSHGNGCSYCSGRKVLPGYNDLATVNPKLAAEWHPTKNGSLTPEQVTKGYDKKVWWLCSRCGHEWAATISNRANNNTGCPVCVRKKGKRKKSASA